MGNNEAYREFEEITIGLYNLGVLTSAMLDVVGGVWEGQDVDAGGSTGLQSHDGKGIERIVAETFDPAVKPEIYPGEPPSYYEAFSEIKVTRWGWV